jgi:DNA-binding transcriptional ArsR family regulator
VSSVAGTSVGAFAALGDPVRADIVRLLAGRDMAAGDIAARFPVSRPAVSRHLRVLREAGLVKSREEAQQRIYSIEMMTMGEMDAFLAGCREIWASRLDELGRLLDARAKEEASHDDG